MKKYSVQTCLFKTHYRLQKHGQRNLQHFTTHQQFRKEICIRKVFGALMQGFSQSSLMTVQSLSFLSMTSLTHLSLEALRHLQGNLSSITQNGKRDKQRLAWFTALEAAKSNQPDK